MVSDTLTQKAAGAPAGAAPAKKEFWALDWVRFILAVYLVLFHTLRDYAPIKDTWIAAVLGLGNMATTVFFILSGFLLTHAYVVGRGGRPINRRSFFVARFSTVYPLHIIGLLLAVVPIALTIYTRGGLSVPLDPEGEATRMLGKPELGLATLMNIALLNAWNPYYLILNIPSWSLSALVFYYALFPFIAPKVYRVKSPVASIVLMGVLFILPGVVADLLGRTDMLTYGLLHHNPLLRMPLFVAGMVMCVLYAREAPSQARHGAALKAVILATIGVGVVLDMQDSHLHVIKNGLYFPAGAAVVWLCACANPAVGDKVRYWGKRLGAISLPIFFLHSPLQQMFLKLERAATAYVTAYSSGGNLEAVVASGRQVEPSLWLYPLYLVPTLVLCLLVQERFVVPLQKWIRTRYGSSGGAAKAAPRTADHETGSLPLDPLLETRPAARDA